MAGGAHRDRSAVGLAALTAGVTCALLFAGAWFHGWPRTLEVALTGAGLVVLYLALIAAVRRGRRGEPSLGSSMAHAAREGLGFLRTRR